MCDLKEYGFCAVQKTYFFHYGLALGVGSWQCIGYFVFFSTSTLTKLQLFSSVYSNGSHFCLVAVILEPRTGVNKGIEFLFRPEKEYGQSLTLISGLKPFILTKHFGEYSRGQTNMAVIQC